MQMRKSWKIVKQQGVQPPQGVANLSEPIFAIKTVWKMQVLGGGEINTPPFSAPTFSSSALPPIKLYQYYT